MEERVLQLIRPSRFQLVTLGKFYRYIREVLERCFEIRGLDGKVTVQGSFAKGTLLSDKWEIDVFVLFSGVSSDWLKSESEEVLKACLRNRVPIVSKYSQHPYVTASFMGLEADIVPVSEIGGRIVGLGVERTPLHTEYVRSRLSGSQKDEVRLLKSFLKGVGIYGAETRVRGFSGYLAELLVIEYGSFRAVIEAATKWRPPVYIDPESVGDKELLAKKYDNSAIIVVDPVDPTRNAAAAVSLESLLKFILASRLYLHKPHEWFFHVTQPRRPLGPGLNGWVVEMLCLGRLETFPPDSIWGKLLRASKSLVNELLGLGFDVIRFETDTDEHSNARITVSLTACELPGIELMNGPPMLSSLERITRFIEKRLRENGAVWPEHTGMRGARPRKVKNALGAVIRWLDKPSSKPLRDLGLKCTVKCRRCGRERVCMPTPPWIAYLLTV